MSGHENKLFTIARWIAKWVRKMRDLFCPSSEAWVEFGPIRGQYSGHVTSIGQSEASIPRCRQVIRDLREARCQNYETGVLENLNNYLECLSFNSAPNILAPAGLVRTLVIILTLQSFLL